MTLRPKEDLGANVVTKNVAVAQDASGDPKIVTAGATEDNVEVTGADTDRIGFLSCVVAIAWLAKLTEAKTLSLRLRIEESADNSSWDAHEELLAATVVATGGTGGSTEAGVTEVDVALQARKRYVRFSVTPDLSATATDIAIWGASASFGGDDTLPAV